MRTSTAESFITRRVLERDIKKEIKDFLRLMGWTTWTNYQTLGSYKGLSDLTAIKDGVVLWIEVKKNGGRQSPDQIRFQKDIERQKGHYILAYSYEDVEREIRNITGERGSLFD